MRRAPASWVRALVLVGVALLLGVLSSTGLRPATTIAATSVSRGATTPAPGATAPVTSPLTGPPATGPPATGPPETGPPVTGPPVTGPPVTRPAAREPLRQPQRMAVDGSAVDGPAPGEWSEALPSLQSLTPVPGSSGGAGTERLVVVPAAPGGGAPKTGPGGDGGRFRVEVEEGIGEDPAEFAASVEATLLDPRSWRSLRGATLRRVDAGPVDFTVTLASAATTDRLCAPLQTHSRYSCARGRRAIINLDRWQLGAAPSQLDLEGYRTYVVNHEVGHVLGHGHAGCPAPGAPAPVMMQQTKGIGSCGPNRWPTQEEQRASER